VQNFWNNQQELWPTAFAGGETFLDFGNFQSDSWTLLFVFCYLEAEETGAPNHATNPASDQFQLK